MIVGTDPTVLYHARFDLATLGRVRRAAAAALHKTGLLPDQTDDLTLAIGEILNNAITHGGGHGEITLTHVDGQLHCRISDEGPGFDSGPDFHRAARPGVTAVLGRGLWLVFTVCPTTTVQSTRYGTHVSLTVDVPKGASADERELRPEAETWVTRS